MVPAVATVMGAVMAGMLGLAVVSNVQAYQRPVSVPGPQVQNIAAPAGAKEAPVPEAERPAKPVTVRLPSIDVQSPLEDLQLKDDGSLAVPEDFQKAGWWAGGTRPGEVGPAVIVGHVDSYTGPAIFYRLNKLEVGATVEVKLADGKVVTFKVDRIAQYPKDKFPSAEVYGPTATPQLRVITCGGSFDRKAKSYDDNIVAYASLVSAV